MKLSSVRIQNWPDFVRRNGIDLSCDCAKQGCANCDNRGIVWPTGDTAYDTGYEVAGAFPRTPYPGTVAFEHQRRIWLADAGNHEEVGPFLGMAWVRLFPNCEWLPEQFGDADSVKDYLRLLPEQDAAYLVEKLRQSLQLILDRATEELRKLEGLGSTRP